MPLGLTFTVNGSLKYDFCVFYILFPSYTLWRFKDNKRNNIFYSVGISSFFFFGIINLFFFGFGNL